MPDPFKEEADYFRSVFLSSPDHIRIISLDGRIEFANPNGLKLMGSNEGRVIGALWEDLWPGAREKEIVKNACAAALAGETSAFRAGLVREGHEPLWLDTTVSSVFRGGSHEVIRILAVSRDVTAEVGSRALLDSILECVPGALFAKVVDTGRFVFMNDAAAELFGHSREELIGRSPDTMVTPRQAEALREADLAVARADGIVTFDAEAVTHLDGQTYIRRIRKKATPGPGIRYVVCLTDNITEEYTREAALKVALEEAEKANLAKSQFLAVMGHEIRSPLNGVLGMAQAMELDELPPEQRGRLKVIREAGRTLLDLLNDMLDLSRISAGGLTLEDGVIDVGELAEAARYLFDSLASEKRLSFDLRINPEIVGLWRGDPTRVRQVLTNLIGNAVKFTDRGWIGLRIHGQDNRLTFEVRDTGPGIPAQMLERIFEPFKQLDPSNTRRHGGSGLGLAICRDLAHLMGGQITVVSEVGKGSTFTLTLPVERIEPSEQVTQTPAADPPRFTSRPLKILAAEDNPLNQLVLRTLMNAMDLTPHIVSNGEEAMAAWHREPWDLILMDVQMPVMDGMEATRLIRAAEQAEGRRRTPIITLTANAMTHQVETYRAAGMDGFVAKPIEVAHLFGAIHTAVAPEAAEDRRVN